MNDNKRNDNDAAGPRINVEETEKMKLGQVLDFKDLILCYRRQEINTQL